MVFGLSVLQGSYTGISYGFALRLLKTINNLFD